MCRSGTAWRPSAAGSDRLPRRGCERCCRYQYGSRWLARSDRGRKRASDFPDVSSFAGGVVPAIWAGALVALAAAVAALIAGIGQ